jgi:hypothetical protein
MQPAIPIAHRIPANDFVPTQFSSICNFPVTENVRVYCTKLYRRTFFHIVDSFRFTIKFLYRKFRYNHIQRWTFHASTEHIIVVKMSTLHVKNSRTAVIKHDGRCVTPTSSTTGNAARSRWMETVNCARKNLN